MLAGGEMRRVRAFLSDRRKKNGGGVHLRKKSVTAIIWDSVWVECDHNLKVVGGWQGRRLLKQRARWLSFISCFLARSTFRPYLPPCSSHLYTIGHFVLISSHPPRLLTSKNGDPSLSDSKIVTVVTLYNNKKLSLAFNFVIISWFLVGLGLALLSRSHQLTS